ncbi:hypothetical protein OAK98_04520 [Mariniblastus sp.]|nr:hypothetical protein [bacterium]MDC0294642.1 hypothetical protein [Mariniblastus sp.]
MRLQSKTSYLRLRLSMTVFGILLLLVFFQIGCSSLRVPAIDPSGNRIFKQGGTPLLTPRSAQNNTGNFNQLGQPIAIAPAYQPQPFTAPLFTQPQTGLSQPAGGPAFRQPATPPPCDGSGQVKVKKQRYVPDVNGWKSPGQSGKIVITPSRIVAPVGSEVVVLAGLCGDDGYFVKNQPLEWMLSNNSVGELIEIGGNHHPTFNKLIPPTSKKISGQYAKGRTSLKRIVLTRGTPTPADDINLAKGQTFVSVSSASPGTSYVTAVAPKSEGWDKRRASTVIHWVDGQWSVPAPVRATAGTVQSLATMVSSADGGGVKGWEARYTIVGGAPAEFAPTGSRSVTATTDTNGKAIAQIRQPAGQLEPGTTQVRVDIVRPPIFGESELIVESGITTVIWRAPALTIRAYGPEKAESDLPFEYIVEITNPGDLVARAVVVKMKNLDSGVNYISSSPSPQQFANTYQWDLGDVTPGGTPKQIRIQLKSNKLGSVGAFFEVVSEADRLKTEAPVETEIIQPCLNLSINGPAEAVEGESISLNLGLENRCGEGLANVKIAIKWPNDFVRLNTNLPQGAASFTNSFMPAAQRDDIPTLTFQTRAAGEHCFEVEVSADGVQTLKKSYCLTVKPKSGGLLNGLNSPVVTAKNQLQLRLDLGNKVQLNKCLVTATITNPSNTDATQITLTNRFSLDLSAAMLKPPQQLQVQPVTDNKKEFFLTIPRIPAGGSYPITIEYAVVPFKQLQDNKSLFSITSLDGTSFSKEIELDLK